MNVLLKFGLNKNIHKILFSLFNKYICYFIVLYCYVILLSSQSHQYISKPTNYNIQTRHVEVCASLELKNRQQCLNLPAFNIQ